VANLTDDNGDGRIDQDDFPDIVFSSCYKDQGELRPAVIRAVDGRDGSPIFDITECEVQQGSNLAVGDINHDGKVEILVQEHWESRLLAFQNDGSYMWTTQAFTPGSNWGGPAIVDINCDGDPEIIMGRTVFTNWGVRKWVAGFGGGKNGDWGPISCISNLDMVGGLELIAGNCAYHSDGHIYWQKADSTKTHFVPPQIEDGFAGVGDFDTDSFPEIAIATRGDFYILNHDGTAKTGPILIPGASSTMYNPGGPPTISDFDSDGLAEIGIASPDSYTVFESDGSILWSRPINEGSSGVTAATVFDLDGDGIPEAIHCDQESLRIFNASNGEILWSREHSSHTALEMPVVADVDRDGHAEVVIGASYSQSAGAYYHGVFVFGQDISANPWVGARGIWNQHTYHISNVNEDGTVPQFKEHSWQTHNTYRCQEAVNAPGVSEEGGIVPQQRVVSLQIHTNPSGHRVRISYGIPASANISLKIYDASGRKLVTLADKYQESGVYECHWDARVAANGIYFCRLQAGDFTETRKMVVVE
jgi:hypothetical protein